jgi:hypothetical protein
MVVLLVLASTATFSGTVFVRSVFRVASVVLITPLIIAPAAVSVRIAAVPRVVDPLNSDTVEVHPVTADGVVSNPSTVMFAGTGI